MRDVAFRAWTEFKTMVDVPTINFATSEALMPDGEWYKVELMQWTGLVDKAGTRIYEGDIVAWSSNDWNNDSPSTYTERQHTQIVRYEEGEGGAGRPEIGFTFERDLIELEVIGNIYQNPELLEQETL